MKKIFLLPVILIALSLSKAYAQVPELALEVFSEGYSEPIDIANCGDARLFIVERGGKIWICDAQGNKSATPFLNITKRVNSNGGEQGLLGLTFHPNYANNGFFFVNYINSNGDTKIARFNVSANDPNQADPKSEKVLLKIEQPFENHNGGCLKFGPDGYLYIGMGDGGDGGDPFELAQDPGELLGKMLRIDVNSSVPYTIPPTNPFLNVAGHRPEIWALGLRNPFRWSFDRLTGDLWIGDVGQDKWEEVNLQAASSDGGENYGWDCREGKHKFEPKNCDSTDFLTEPIANYKHDGSDCTVIGGYVYRGSQYPNMYGKYIYTDFCSGRFRTIFSEDGNWKNIIVLEGDPFEYVGFGEDAAGELYVADNAGGEICKVTDVSMMLQKWTTGFETSSVSVYPNPSNGQFTVSMQANTNDEKFTLEIFNLMGQQLSTEVRDVTEGMNQWNLSFPHLSTGTYYLVIRSDEALMRTKISIQ